MSKGREFKVGNATIILNSPLMDMTEEERKAWYATELKKGNPTLLRIVEAMRDCYRKHD
ncbi:hypothetical protein [Peribacillus butanolivorans]|uniref:hypothetical protein n=1 Tax=Peribacillus butanolivorans TaxID=421767 RepID=UPI00366A6374